MHARTLTVNMLLFSMLDCISPAKSHVDKVFILVILFGDKLGERGTISVILQTPCLFSIFIVVLKDRKLLIFLRIHLYYLLAVVHYFLTYYLRKTYFTICFPTWYCIILNLLSWKNQFDHLLLDLVLHYVKLIIMEKPM